MIRHLAGIAEIVDDIEEAVGFYRDNLGLRVQHEKGSDYAEVEIPGVLHYGIWSRTGAAETVFGDPEAAQRIPLGFTVGFEVDEVDEASTETSEGGGTVVQLPKTEPWCQKPSRFFSPSGALCEFSETPGARKLIRDSETEPAKE
jgi:catechol 2,3-dioxygenase-like lactoylglutathione lyase family enzyme